MCPTTPRVELPVAEDSELARLEAGELLAGVVRRDGVQGDYRIHLGRVLSLAWAEDTVELGDEACLVVEHVAVGGQLEVAFLLPPDPDEADPDGEAAEAEAAQEPPPVGAPATTCSCAIRWPVASLTSVNKRS